MAEKEITLSGVSFVFVDSTDTPPSDNQKQLAKVSWNSYVFSCQPSFCTKILSWFTGAEPKSPLLDLPLELQDHIFSFLDQTSLKAVSQTCKLFEVLTLPRRLPMPKLIERMWKTNKYPDLPHSKIKQLCAQLFRFEQEIEGGKALTLLPHIKESKPLAPYNSGERILPLYSFIAIEHEGKLLQFPFEITRKAGKVFAHFYHTS